MGISRGEILADPPGTQALSTDASPDRTKEAKTVACPRKIMFFKPIEELRWTALLKTTNQIAHRGNKSRLK